MKTTVPVTAIIITKNEGPSITRCIEAARFCDQILVVDSNSEDQTAELARRSGATVVPFDWNGAYPKKKQWGMQHAGVSNNWVLHLHADEIVTPALRREIVALFDRRTPVHVAFEIPLTYVFSGKRLRFGHRVIKRALVDKRSVVFPDVHDLTAPGITEVEGHYQPVCDGTIGQLSARLLHEDLDPVASWVGRHNRYSDWEAHLRTSPATRAEVRSNRSKQRQIFDATPFKPLAFFLYTYFVRFGILDGRPGFDYAFALTWYYWLIDVKARERSRSEAAQR